MAAKENALDSQKFATESLVVVSCATCLGGNARASSDGAIKDRRQQKRIHGRVVLRNLPDTFAILLAGMAGVKRAALRNRWL
jgi:hypothetical protein